MPSAAKDIERIVAAYPNRGRRQSLAAVSRLRAKLDLGEPLAAVVVVGTNGKTSTATYLQRLLTASGVRTGLYSSPHLSEWSERVRIDGVACDPAELVATLTAVHERAAALAPEPSDLRFFDLLTLAAELIFRRAGVELAVFEAGVGGRYDAVRTVRPSLVLLTGVALDHTEILGEGLEQILTEKLLVAPAGATVISSPLGELAPAAERLAAEAGFRLSWLERDADRTSVPHSLPGYLGDALLLAVAGWRSALAGLGQEPPPSVPEIDLAVAGRLERGERDGTPFVLDAAHNEAAWLRLSAELSAAAPAAAPPLTAVVSVSPGKDREGLATALLSLPGFDSAIVTRHRSLPAAAPEAVAAELRQGDVAASVADDAEEATRLGFERARNSGGVVVFFGSTHLVGEVRELLAGDPATQGSSSL